MESSLKIRPLARLIYIRYNHHNLLLRCYSIIFLRNAISFETPINYHYIDFYPVNFLFSIDILIRIKFYSRNNTDQKLYYVVVKFIQCIEWNHKFTILTISLIYYYQIQMFRMIRIVKIVIFMSFLVDKIHCPFKLTKQKRFVNLFQLNWYHSDVIITINLSPICWYVSLFQYWFILIEWNNSHKKL